MFNAGGKFCVLFLFLFFCLCFFMNSDVAFKGSSVLRTGPGPLAEALWGDSV